MSKTKFTKGEWQLFMPLDDEDYNNSDDEIVIGMSTFIDNPCHHDTIHKIVIEGFSFDGDSSEETANAHLIKTAPKLYSMLKSLINSKEHDVLFEMQTEIEELLAEARGE